MDTPSAILKKLLQEMDRDTKVIPMQGWSQAVAITHGKGRVLILGEAGMLSAQVVGARRVPMG